MLPACQAINRSGCRYWDIEDRPIGSDESERGDVSLSGSRTCCATDKQFRQSEIIIGFYGLVSPYLNELPNLKWLQGTAAGVDSLFKYVDPKNPPTFIVSRFTGKYYGTLMSEYVLTQITNYERDLYKTFENQRTGKGWVRCGKVNNYRSVIDLTIGILGTGNIGNRIAKTLSFMGANVLAFGRNEFMDLKENNHILKYFTFKTLPEFLQSCDYIVSVLPDTKETKGLLNGNILENCKECGTIFMNIGRGSVISEQCLVNALNKKWLSGAILDVFEKEPLSDASSLWKMTNVFITPHVSGTSRAKDIAEVFQDNFKLFESNSPLPARVDFSRGY